MTSLVHVSTKSKQDYATPDEFLTVVDRIYPLSFDLASTRENKISTAAYIDGEVDSLAQDWHKIVIPEGGNLWLNPPYKSVKPWMEKCRDEADKGAKIISLTLASVGSKWYNEIVKPNALSLILLSRIRFAGCKDPFPKDLMITVWGYGMTGLGYWNWEGK